MGRIDYLAMKTDQETAELLNSDFNELKMAAKKLIDHATKLGGLGFGTSLLKWVASFAAIYLLILDRTNWRTNMLTALLVPYIFFSFHSGLFHLLRLAGDARFIDSFLLLVVAPNFFAHSVRDSWVGVAICLAIGCYLLQEHMRASSGFRNSFTQSHDISNTVGIILLLVYPIWALVVHAV